MKKIFAASPKEMAKYLAGVAKELRKVLKEYAAINKEASAEQASAASADAMPSMPTIPSTSEAASGANDSGTNDSGAKEADQAVEAKDEVTKADSASAEASQASSDGAKAEAETKGEGQSPATTASTTPTSEAAAEAKQDKEDKIAEAKGDLSFAKEVRDFVRAMRKAMEETKIKTFFNQDDPKVKEKLFKETNEQFKALEDDLKTFMNEVQKDIPPESNGPQAGLEAGETATDAPVAADTSAAIGSQAA